MKPLAPVVLAALITLSACTSSDAEPPPDPVGIGISCGSASEEGARFAAPSHAWELPPEERQDCGGFWVGDYPKAAQLHDYTDLEREALETADVAESWLPDLYGRCAATNLGFSNEIWDMHDDPAFWADSPLKQLRGSLVLCPDHPERKTVEEQSAQAAEAEAQREQGE